MSSLSVCLPPVLNQTLGIGSFGKASVPSSAPPRTRGSLCRAKWAVFSDPAVAGLTVQSATLQVKLAEHALTGHKVAIKILNRKKIKSMDMDEKGARKMMRLGRADRAIPKRHGPLSHDELVFLALDTASAPGTWSGGHITAALRARNPIHRPSRATRALA